MIVFALLIHITTAIFFICIVMVLRESKLNVKLVKSRKILFFATILLVSFSLAFSLAFKTNQDGWIYYVTERASNHYIVSTATPFQHQWVLVFSIIILWFLNISIAKFNKKFIISVLISIAYFISQVAYVNYAIPIVLVALIIILSKTLQRPLIILLSIQSVLFVLQASEIQIVSITSSLFIPGTRFNSIFVLTLIMLIVIEIKVVLIAKIKPTRLELKNFNVYQPAFNIVILVFVFAVSFGKSMDAYQAIQSSAETKISFKVKAGKQYLPIGVDTVGLREFQNMNIYVDEYPFWGDLSEYAQRSKFKNELIESIENFQLTPLRAEELRTSYHVNERIILYVTREYGTRYNLQNCKIYSKYYTCVLW